MENLQALRECIALDQDQLDREEREADQVRSYVKRANRNRSVDALLVKERTWDEMLSLAAEEVAEPSFELYESVMLATPSGGLKREAKHRSSTRLSNGHVRDHGTISERGDYLDRLSDPDQRTTVRWTRVENGVRMTTDVPASTFHAEREPSTRETGPRSRGLSYDQIVNALRRYDGSVNTQADLNE